MSNHLAIATATATLVAMLDQAVSARVNGATAVHRRPDGTNGAGPPDVGVNVFLYQAIPNAAFRSMDAPTRGPGGGLAQRPLIGLDLHYLLSFHGNDADLEPQRCMGAAVQGLQSRPVLSRAQIQSLLAGLAGQDPNHFLLPSNLIDQIDTVKFSPQPMSLDEMSKLWSVFFQTPYALSICYTASVVVIEGEETPPTPLPVQERFIAVVPMDGPAIDRVRPETVVFGGVPFEVLGRGFLRPGVVALLGETPAVLDPSSTDTRALLTPGAGTRAGVALLRFELPSPLGPGHAGISSNAYPVQIRPDLTNIAFNGGANPFFRATVSPVVGAAQDAKLLLTEFGNPMPANARSFTISIGRRAADSATLDFPADGIPAATYLARLQIDGATSPLDMNNANPPAFIGPTVVRP